MKKTTCCGMGSLLLISAAVSAVTTLAVLVVHTLCVHRKHDALCECEGVCVPLTPTEGS